MLTLDELKQVLICIVRLYIRLGRASDYLYKNNTKKTSKSVACSNQIHANLITEIIIYCDGTNCKDTKFFKVKYLYVKHFL